MSASSKQIWAIGTRKSALAQWQTQFVSSLLMAAWPQSHFSIKFFSTQGDVILEKPLPQIGGKGLFTQELENALREGEIDFAVHSLKDLPVEHAPGLTLGAIFGRNEVRDVLIARHDWTLETLPESAIVGTSSLRRQAQLLDQRSDLRVRSIRGNVGTRIEKVVAGDFDAIVLAGTGVERLSLSGHISQWLPLDVMLPAPGQGALAVQCREDDTETLNLLAEIDAAELRMCTHTERTFLHALGAGCSTPVAAYATLESGVLAMSVLAAAPDGSEIVRAEGVDSDPVGLGNILAERVLSLGGGEILARV